MMDPPFSRVYPLSTVVCGGTTTRQTARNAGDYEDAASDFLEKTYTDRSGASSGTFSLPVPGPVDSADTLGGQGSPRSRSKSLHEKDFRVTYCLGVHC